MAVEERAEPLAEPSPVIDQRAPCPWRSTRSSWKPSRLAAKNSRPVVRPVVGLRRGADGVVAVPAEARRSDAMQPRQPRTERRIRARGGATELDPLECQEGLPGRRADAQHPRHAQRRGAREFTQAVRLGREHLEAGFRAKLDEQRAAVAVPPHALADAAATDALRRTGLDPSARALRECRRQAADDGLRATRLASRREPRRVGGLDCLDIGAGHRHSHDAIRLHFSSPREFFRRKSLLVRRFRSAPRTSAAAT